MKQVNTVRTQYWKSVILFNFRISTKIEKNMRFVYAVVNLVILMNGAHH